jgi:DNA-binding transcriptional LysR family regulator
MAETNLDIDVLRTLVLAQQLGTLNRAARQVGRSQSAISQQMQKLEERVGQPLFRKHGRGRALTEAGEIVFAYARRIVELNDEAVSAVRGVAVGGTVRFGLPGDFAEHWLPAVLGRFKRAHPTVRIEATVDRNSSLIECLDKGDLDLIMALTNNIRADDEVLSVLPMVWIGARNAPWKTGDVVPLAVFESPCMFRAAAINALEAAGLPWRVAFTSPSMAGLWAAVEAGLGIAVRTETSVPRHLAALGTRSGLPPLPSVNLCLSSAGRPLSPAATRLRAILLETLPSDVAMTGRTTDQRMMRSA